MRNLRNSYDVLKRRNKYLNVLGTATSPCEKRLITVSSHKKLLMVYITTEQTVIFIRLSNMTIIIRFVSLVFPLMLTDFT
jgi:hypothetical protein